MLFSVYYRSFIFDFTKNSRYSPSISKPFFDIEMLLLKSRYGYGRDGVLKYKIKVYPMPSPCIDVKHDLLICCRKYAVILSS